MRLCAYFHARSSKNSNYSSCLHWIWRDTEYDVWNRPNIQRHWNSKSFNTAYRGDEWVSELISLYLINTTNLRWIKGESHVFAWKSWMRHLRPSLHHSFHMHDVNPTNRISLRPRQALLAGQGFVGSFYADFPNFDGQLSWNSICSWNRYPFN